LIISKRLRELREEKKLTQGDIEKRTGLLRCYLSRVENGHTIPSVETLEKLASALRVPLYRLFYDGEGPPALTKACRESVSAGAPREISARDSSLLSQLRSLLGHMEEERRELLLHLVKKIAIRRSGNHLKPRTSRKAPGA
jgi:transcriptional regulator with XRE-family HTH domain